MNETTIIDVKSEPSSESRDFGIPQPRNLRDVGIRKNFLQDLALKILYLEGELTLLEVAHHMRLSLSVVEELFQALRKDYCEVKGMVGNIHRIACTSMGKSRALELLAHNQYTGPAPVTLEDYISRVRAQSIRAADVHPPDIGRALQHLVLTAQTLVQLGAAVVSGGSIFLYGPTGTGKTSIAESLPGIYKDPIWVPYAVEVSGQIITVYDATVHHPAAQSLPRDHDGRWVLCRRPHLLAGGELTMEMLDLQLNRATNYYVAPLQMRANNGVLIIDDFGRQRIRPEELLNRWIVPLDRRIDFLTLAGGTKFEIPFDVLVVFATNLDPARLADEAFLRRIQNKVKVDSLSAEDFHAIFRMLCSRHQLAYDPGVVQHLIETLTVQLKQPLRACYPGDIIGLVRAAARYEGKEAALDRNSVMQACRNYFLRV